MDINPEDYYGGDISIATWADGVVIYTNYYCEDPVFTSFFRVVSLDNPQEPEVLGLLSSANNEEMQSAYKIAVFDDIVYVPKGFVLGPNQHAYYISIEDPYNPQINLFDEQRYLSGPLAIHELDH